jgi:hypothetical protein
MVIRQGQHVAIKTLLNIAELAKNDPLHLLRQLLLQDFGLLSTKMDHLHCLVQFGFSFFASSNNSRSGRLGAVGTKKR